MRKSGTAPTKGQKKFIKERMRLKPENWLVVRDNHICIEIRNRLTGNCRTAFKEVQHV